MNDKELQEIYEDNRPCIWDAETQKISPAYNSKLIEQLSQYNYNKNLLWVIKEQIENEKYASQYRITDASQGIEYIVHGAEKTTYYNVLHVEGLPSTALQIGSRPDISNHDSVIDHFNREIMEGSLAEHGLNIEYTLFAKDDRQSAFDPETNTIFMKHPNKYKTDANFQKVVVEQFAKNYLRQAAERLPDVKNQYAAIKLENSTGKTDPKMTAIARDTLAYLTLALGKTIVKEGVLFAPDYPAASSGQLAYESMLMLHRSSENINLTEIFKQVQTDFYREIGVNQVKHKEGALLKLSQEQEAAQNFVPSKMSVVKKVTNAIKRKYSR